MTDAEILAGATRKDTPLWAHEPGRAIGFFWPDGFKFGSRIDAYCDEAKAERDAVRVRREWLERADGG